MARTSPPRRPSRALRYDRDAELLLIAEASRWLADAPRVRGPEAVRSVTAMLDRQQRVAACRALGRSLDA
jgi:hypothetical protein